MRLAGAAFALVAGITLHAGEPVNPDSLIIQDFEKRVAQYRQLHKDVETRLHPLKPTPSQEAITRHEHELARALREARGQARQGDIFTPEIAGEFKRLIALATQGQDAARVHQSLRSAEPVQLRLRVNDSYPAGIPLQSTPPTLLVNLPPLREELQYHLVGRDLVLLDVKANLIVDMVLNVI